MTDATRVRLGRRGCWRSWHSARSRRRRRQRAGRRSKRSSAYAAALCPYPTGHTAASHLCSCAAAFLPLVRRGRNMRLASAAPSSYPSPPMARQVHGNDPRKRSQDRVEGTKGGGGSPGGCPPAGSPPHMLSPAAARVRFRPAPSAHAPASQRSRLHRRPAFAFVAVEAGRMCRGFAAVGSGCKLTGLGFVNFSTSTRRC